jgi:hypothetical protein
MTPPFSIQTIQFLSNRNPRARPIFDNVVNKKLKAAFNDGFTGMETN